jgi:hypothetical protein
MLKVSLKTFVNHSLAMKPFKENKIKLNSGFKFFKIIGNDNFTQS